MLVLLNVGTEKPAGLSQVPPGVSGVRPDFKLPTVQLGRFAPPEFEYDVHETLGEVEVAASEPDDASETLNGNPVCLVNMPVNDHPPST